MNTPKPPLKSVKRSPGRPRRQEVKDIEKVLLSAALAEFLEHGYGGASVSNIVRQAGVSKTTLYSRYSSKEDIFKALITRQVQNLSPADLLTADDNPLSLRDGLHRYANHMLDISLKGDILRVNRLLYAESHRFPELAAAATMRTQMGVDRITQFIQDCAEHQGRSDLDAKALAEVFIFSMRGWYFDVMITPRKVTAAQRRAWADKVVQVLLVDQQTN